MFLALNFFEIYSVIPKNFLFKKLFLEIGPLINLEILYFFMRFFSRPGHFFGLIGLMLSAIGSLILVHLVSLKLLYGLDIGDRPLLVAGTLLVVVGIQLVSLGVIGEILSRTYFASSKEKSYFIRWDSNEKE